MPKFTASELVIAERLSKNIYRYERIFEENAAVLRKDPEDLARVYKEYEAISSKPGFTPPRDQIDYYTKESEKILERHCTSSLDRVYVVNAAFFLAQLAMDEALEHGEHFHLEVVRRKVALDKKHPYIFPESPAVQVAINDIEPPDYPLVLPAPSFKSIEIMGLRRRPIHETEFIRYQQQPELLQKGTFFYPLADNEHQFYRVSAFLTTDKEKIYYVVFADEGAEAVGWSTEHFFDFLRKSQQVIT